MKKRNLSQRNNASQTNQVVQTAHNTFGGLIFRSDFNTMHHSSNMVQRIISDMIFDEQCKRAALQRDMEQSKKIESER